MGGRTRIERRSRHPLQLDLPTTRERLRLIIESDPEETQVPWPSRARSACAETARRQETPWSV